MGSLFSIFSSKTNSNSSKPEYQGRSYINDEGDGHFGGKIKKSHKSKNTKNTKNKTKKHR
jgi:hypothetical protein